MKIKRVTANHRKHCFEILTSKGLMELPYARLELTPTPQDKLKDLFVDRELGREAFTYVLESGRENTVPIDQILEYSRDPDYLREMLLYKLTLQAQKLLKELKVSRRAVIRRMGTSPTQFYRLLDQTNYGKSIDEMLRLLAALDCQVSLSFKRAA